MRRDARAPRPLRSRLTAVGATMALVVGGMGATAIVAPAAFADTPNVVNPLTGTVTADALPTTQIDGVAWDQEIVGSKVYVAGSFANARPAGAAPGTSQTSRNNLLAYNLDTGELDQSFNPNLNAQAYAVAKSPDGKRVYVGGNFTKVGSVNRYRIAAFDTATGALITTFNPQVDYSVKSIVATNDTVYVAGAFSKSGSTPRSRLAAFKASNGALLPWAPSADATVNALTLTPDGSALIAGGMFQNVNGSSAYGLAKIDVTSGALLPWAASEKIRNAGASSAILSLNTDGQAIYGTGYTFGGGGNLEGTFSADPATGNVNWVEDCHGDTYDSWAGNGTVYTVSHAHYCGNLGGFPQSDPWSINMRHAVAFTTDARTTLAHDPLGYFDWYGTPAPGMVNWFPDLAVGSYTGKSQAAWTVTGNDKYVVMGGEFPSVNGVGQQGLVRFAVKGVSPNKIGPTYSGSQINPTVISVGSGARVSWTANSDRDDKTLTYTLTRDGQTVYQTTADSTFWDRPAMGFQDKNLTPGQTYKYRLRVSDPSGNTVQSDIVNYTASSSAAPTAYAQRVVSDGAATYWPLNETSGTAIRDNAGFTDATASGALTQDVPGAVAGDPATTFGNGVTASTANAITAPNTFTTQAWINTTTTTGGKILGFGSNQTGNSGSYDRHIYMDNDGRIFFGVYPGYVATLNSGPGYNDGQWHQITTSLGAGGMKLFIDGKLVASRTDVTSGQPFSGYWRLGGDNIGGWPNQPASSTFNGTIDEVAIYPTELTRETIDAQWVASGRTSTIPARPADTYGATVYDDNAVQYWRLGETTGSTAADSSKNGDWVGTYENGVTQGAAGGIKGTDSTAATFDGIAGAVIGQKAVTNPTNYSEEAWFKTSTTNGGKIIGFGSSNAGRSGSYDRHVYMNPDGTLTFGTWTGFANTISTPNALNDDQWHHIVATQSSADGMKFYVDGQLVGTNPQTAAEGYTGYWRIGGDNSWNAGSGYFAGTIDDAAVYNGVLTPAQVADHYTKGSTGAAANKAPTASLTATATGGTAALDASGSADVDGSIVSYAWDFGDGTTATTATPTTTHQYGTSGTKTVTVTVTDNAGATATANATVTVNQAPTAAFTATASGLTAAVDASGSTDFDGSIASYAWDFGDGSTGTGATASHTYATGGTKTITLTVTDSAGATASVSHTVDVVAPNQSPTANFSVTATQLTANVDATGSADSDGSIVSYAWDFGDGATATGVTASHSYTSAGTKTITLTVTDDKGATTTTSQPVQVTAPPPNQLPAASFTAATDGLTANVESTSTDADGTVVAWAWNFGDGSPTVDTQAATHTYTAAGKYTVSLTVTDNQGGTSTTTKEVTVTAPPPANKPPVAAFTSTSSGLAATVTSTSTDPDGTVDAYSWNFGDGTTDLASTPTANHTFEAPGTYQVSLTVTDNAGATTTVTQPVTVTAPTPSVLAKDTFSRTLSNSWGSADNGGAWTLTGGASNFSVSGGVGKVKLGAPGAQTTATLGALSSADVDLATDVSLDKVATGGGTYVTLSARKVGTSEYRTTARFVAGGSVQLQLVKITSGVSTTLKSQTVGGLTYNAGDTLTVRFQVTGSNSAQLNAKVWKAGTAEPAAWSVSAVDTNAPLTAAGGVALTPYLSGSATNAPVTVSIDNLTATAVRP